MVGSSEYLCSAGHSTEFLVCVAIRINRFDAFLSDIMNTYLTYSMAQNPSWEANWFAASQEILRNSRNPKVHYRTHKRPSPVSIPGQPNPVHKPTSNLLEIHPNIIHPSMPRSPQWSPSLRFPHQDLYTPLSSPIRATCPAHLILLDFITRKIFGEEYKSFSSSLCNPPLPRYLIPPRSKYSPQHNVLKHPQLPFSYLFACCAMFPLETLPPDFRVLE